MQHSSTNHILRSLPSEAYERLLGQNLLVGDVISISVINNQIVIADKIQEVRARDTLLFDTSKIEALQSSKNSESEILQGVLRLVLFAPTGWIEAIDASEILFDLCPRLQLLAVPCPIIWGRGEIFSTIKRKCSHLTDLYLYDFLEPPHIREWQTDITLHFWSPQKIFSRVGLKTVTPSDITGRVFKLSDDFAEENRITAQILTELGGTVIYHDDQTQQEEKYDYAIDTVEDFNNLLPTYKTDPERDNFIFKNFLTGKLVTLDDTVFMHPESRESKHQAMLLSSPDTCTLGLQLAHEHGLIYTQEVLECFIAIILLTKFYPDGSFYQTQPFDFNLVDDILADSNNPLPFDSYANYLLPLMNLSPKTLENAGQRLLEYWGVSFHLAGYTIKDLLQLRVELLAKDIKFIEIDAKNNTYIWSITKKLGRRRSKVDVEQSTFLDIIYGRFGKRPDDSSVLLDLRTLELLRNDKPSHHELLISCRKEKKTQLFGDYHALLIAAEQYENPSINDLAYPLKDVQKLATVLKEEYQFATTRVQILVNPTRVELINRFDQLADQLSKQDNLLLCWAGHGFWDEQLQQGFWLPTESKQSSRSAWLCNGTVRDYLCGIQSQHSLLISDTCFSGSIFKTRSTFDGNSSDNEIKEDAIKKIYNIPSRRVISSGGSMEVVPDRSLLMEYLIDTLQRNKFRFLSSEQLFVKLKPAVINNSSTTPLTGTIQQAGDEGGDFIFIRK